MGAGEQQSLISQVGGNYTYGIQTGCSYFSSTLPASQLDLALFLEADRMRSLEITPAGLSASRATVLEQGAAEENRPYGAFRNVVQQTFTNPVNQRSFFGGPDDVKAITIDDVTQFYKNYYQPSNAVLVLVGDFDPKAARERIRHYFESIPTTPAPAAPDLSEPARTAERRETVTDPLAKVPAVLISWQVPSLTDPDWFTLKALLDLLRGTQVSRLGAGLVKGAGVVSEIEGELGTSAGPNYFFLALVAVPGKDLGQIERLAFEEIDRIGREGVPDDEMERLRLELLRRRAMELVTSGSRAVVLAYLITVGAGPDAINGWENGERRLTSDELRRVAKKYLTANNRSVVVVNPGASK